MNSTINQKWILVISVLNSFYLAFVHLKAFFLEENTTQLANNAVAGIFTSLLILVTLLNINIFKKPLELFSSFRNIMVFISLLLFHLTLGIFIYQSLEKNGGGQLFHWGGIFMEVICIIFAVQKSKIRRINNLLKVFSLWFIIAVISFSVMAFSRQYLDLPNFSNDLNVIFVTIFFHFANACFFVRQYLQHSAKTHYS